MSAWCIDRIDRTVSLDRQATGKNKQRKETDEGESSFHSDDRAEARGVGFVRSIRPQECDHCSKYRQPLDHNEESRNRKFSNSATVPLIFVVMT